MRDKLKPQALLAVFLILFTMISLTFIYIQSTYAETKKVSNIVQIPSADGSNQPESYYVYDINQKSVIQSSNPEIKRPPASTTKILTGLVAWQFLGSNLDSPITVGNEVLVDGSGIGLQPGDQITARQLFTAMYLASANDAAAALAVKSSGSINAFAAKMNQYAISLGCTQSHFTNPHGLSDPQHYTTAEDLAKISLAFVQNQDLLHFVSQQSATVQWKGIRGGERSVQIYNTNKFLGVYPGIKGLKTGTTTDAGQCLVSYYQSTEGEYLFVLLGAQQRYRSMLPLLDKALSQGLLENLLSDYAVSPRSLLDSPGIY